MSSLVRQDCNLKPYPTMKDTGVPWLGAVPVHWALRRTKTLLRERVQKGFPDEPLLAATQTKGVVLKEEYENRTVLALKDLHLLKLVKIGDFVISLRSFQGGIEYARQQGIISPAYTVLYPVQSDMHGFLAALFKSRPYLENLSLYVTGIRQGQNIDYEKLSRSELPLPPPAEQAAIVRYLDYMDRRIRKYIRIKQKLIKLLEEQKQAIIRRAVTRGLNPHVRLKPSGVPWLGEVPEHWEILRGKYVGKLFSTPSVPDHELTDNGDGHAMYLKVSDLARTDGALRLRQSKLYVKSRRLVANRDNQTFLVFPKRDGAIYTNKVGIVETYCLLDPNLMGWEISERFDPLYVALLVKTRTLKDLADVSSVPQINNKHIDPILFPAPPIAEQATILSQLDRDLAGFNTAVVRTQNEIDLLREYRTRLIADAVTGKLDVREAAANLPNETGEAETLDDIETLAEGDGDGESANLDVVPEEAEA
ncbi:MAG: hypothetical protein ABSG75_08205 [Syntrophales bacterium]|jgi:type I restriction enzyme S subunit